MLQLYVAQKCCREQQSELQRAAKRFQWECHTRKRIKRDSVLSVLFFMCDSALGGTWGLGLERVLLSQTL